MSRMRRWFRSYFLTELIRGLRITWAHLRKRKVTVQYPEEKHLSHRVSEVCMRCAVTPMEKSAALPVSYARQSVLRQRLR